MKVQLKSLAQFALLAAVAVTICFPPQSLARDQLSTPAQTAYLQSEIKKAQKVFADKVAAIAGVGADKIIKILPTDWRAGDPKFAIIPALEKERGMKFSDEQRQQITAADREMKEAIEASRTEAKKR